MRGILALICLCLVFLLPHPAAARDVVAGPVNGVVIEVIDGDTLRVRMHIWIGQQLETLVRIDGIDTPEKHGKCASERAKAEEARLELARLVGDGVQLFNIRHEKYAGRVLAETRTGTGADVAESLTAKGLARPYHGGKRAGWCG